MFPLISICLTLSPRVTLSNSLSPHVTLFRSPYPPICVTLSLSLFLCHPQCHFVLLSHCVTLSCSPPRVTLSCSLSPHVTTYSLSLCHFVSMCYLFIAFSTCVTLYYFLSSCLSLTLSEDNLSLSFLLFPYRHFLSLSLSLVTLFLSLTLFIFLDHFVLLSHFLFFTLSLSLFWSLCFSPHPTLVTLPLFNPSLFRLLFYFLMSLSLCFIPLSFSLFISHMECRKRKSIQLNLAF